MKCLYCGAPGTLRAGKQDGAQGDVHVCDGCWKLLKNPKTALPLIRGHLMLTLRGKVPPTQLEQDLNRYMEMISAWKPRN